MKYFVLFNLALTLFACGPTPDPATPIHSNQNSTPEASASASPAFSVDAAKAELLGCWDGEVDRVRFKTDGLAKGMDMSLLTYPNKNNQNDFQISSVNFDAEGSFIRNKESSAAINYTYAVEGDALTLTREDKPETRNYMRCK